MAGNEISLVDSDFPLLRAIEHAKNSGSTEIFDRLLKTKEIDVNASQDGNTALGKAVYYRVQSHPESPYKLITSLKREGYLYMVERLIEAGADRNCEWSVYGTLIFIAAGCDDIELLRVLVENSDDVNVVENRRGVNALNSERSRFYPGKTALTAATINGRVENIKLLRAKGAKFAEELADPNPPSCERSARLIGKHFG